MNRLIYLVACTLFLSGCASVSASRNTGDRVNDSDTAAEAAVETAPTRLPDDLLPKVEPPPPPNHDGMGETDAGTTIQDAVLLSIGEFQGRIGEEDPGDGWLLHDIHARVVALQIENPSESTTLRARFLDHQERPVLWPPPWEIKAGEASQIRLELPRTDSEQKLLLIVEADTPMDYHVRLHSK